MPLFDRYVAVDWSARNQPATGVDSIWVADRDANGHTEFANPPTRRIAERLLHQILEAAAGDRLLIGVDAALGYPAGSAALVGAIGRSPWEAMWDVIGELSTDDDRNRNNRFEVAAELNRRSRAADGPFWGRTAGSDVADLRPKKPRSFPVGEFRAHERALRGSGQHPASVWQLMGVGSVGSQTLTLLPVLRRLRRTWHDRVQIWPFTFTDPSALAEDAVVIVEIWPTLFPGEYPITWIRDAAQMQATTSALAAADAAGELDSWFAPTWASGDHRSVVGEEGWIFRP